MHRIAVKYQGKALMPMKSSKADRLIKSGLAKIKFNRKINEHYLILLFNPSGDKCQDITLGIDPGSMYDGFSVVSKRYHHTNAELVHRTKKGKNSIKAFKSRQAMNRRVRRSRLRHRLIRFSNRTKSKLAPTINANYEYRKWYISQITKIYPITKCVVEDVRFNHYEKTDGCNFSHVELGKNKLYDFIEALGLSLELYAGFETHKLRVNSFGADPKVKRKDLKIFEAHCIDSFVLACGKAIIINKNGKILFGGMVLTNDLKLNRVVVYIEKTIKVRRCLTRTRARYKESKNYYKLAKGGIKIILEKKGKPNICRIKPEGIHTNHPKNWIYIDNGQSERIKCNTAPYGGTRLNGKSSFKKNEWQNRTIEKNPLISCT